MEPQSPLNPLPTSATSTNAKEALDIIKNITTTKNKKQIKSGVDQLSILLRTDKTLNLQEKVLVAKKMTEINVNYKKTHSKLKRIANALLTKLHIRTDFYAIDALQKIDENKRLVTLAIQAGDAQALSDLLESGLDPNLQTDIESMPAIHLAAAMCRIEIIQLLLEFGANINIPDNDTITPLIRMTRLSPPQTYAVIQYLVDKGADLSIKPSNPEWNTALLEMTRFGDLEGMEILLKAGANPDGSQNDIIPLHQAIYGGNIDAVKLLLKYKANPNIPNVHKQTSLYYCVYPRKEAPVGEAWNGRLETLRLLLAAGADPNYKTDGYNKPIDYLPLDAVNQLEVRYLFFTLLEAGTPMRTPYLRTPDETRIMSVMDQRRQNFAQRCMEQETSNENMLQYKKIIYHHTHWLTWDDIGKDPDYQRMYFEDITKLFTPPPSVVDKSDFHKDCLIKVRTKNSLETKIYPANRVLLEQESDFFAAYNLAKDVENLYEHIPERITPEEFEKVLRHIEGIEEFDRKKDIQKNFDFFGLKPFNKSIKNFASMWDLSTELPYCDRPKKHLSDMLLTCRDGKKIPVHKTVLEALSQDKKISPLLEEGIMIEDSSTVNNFLHVLYTEDTSQLWNEEEVVAVINLCHQFGINKKHMTGLGTRYYELALPRLLNDSNALTSLSEEEKLLLKNLPVGYLDLDPYSEITPAQFTTLLDLMSHDFLPEIKFANCTHLSNEELLSFEKAFATNW